MSDKNYKKFNLIVHAYNKHIIIIYKSTCVYYYAIKTFKKQL